MQEQEQDSGGYRDPDLPSGHQQFANPGMSSEEYLNRIAQTLAGQVQQGPQRAVSSDVLTADFTLKMEAGLWQLLLDYLNNRNGH